MQKAVISVGGSVLIPGNDDAVYIRQLGGTVYQLDELGIGITRA